jgi:DNA invertase Pin-like site-specific DNA recombinase
MSGPILANGKPQKQVAPPQPPALLLAAIYARVSTEDQGKGYSISTQIEACRALARREGYTVPESYVLTDDLSGTTMERPGLRQLRELIQAHVITAIIVHDPDRLSRNLGHQLLLAEELEQAGVTLLIVSHPLEHGPEGWLFFQMRGALAEYERAKILERTARGRLGRAKAGHTWGGQVPLGYRAIREPHKARWEVDDEEAVVVRQIYALYLSGKSAREIARLLTDERIPTRLDRRQGDGGRKTRAGGRLGTQKRLQHFDQRGVYRDRVFWQAPTRDANDATRAPPGGMDCHSCATHCRAGHVRGRAGAARQQQAPGTPQSHPRLLVDWRAVSLWPVSAHHEWESRAQPAALSLCERLRARSRKEMPWFPAR